MLSSSAQTALMVLLPLYVLELGHSPSVAALMLASRGIGQLLADIPASMVVGRWGDKPCLLLGGLSYLLGFCFLAFVESPWLLGLGGMVIGFGMSFSMLGRQSYVGHRAPGHQRGRAMSLMAGAMRIGALLGPALGGLAAATWGYQATFLGLVVVCAVTLLIVALSADKGVPEEHKSEHDLASIIAVAKEHKQVLLSSGLVMICLQFMRAGRVALLPLAGAALGLPVEAVGFLASAGALTDALMFVPAGVIMDRWGRKASAAPSLFLFASGLSLMAWSESYPMLLASVLLMGAGNGLSSGLVMVLGADHAPEQGRARFLGVWKLFSDTGHSAGPFAVSALLSVSTLLVSTQVVSVIGFLGIYVLFTQMRETLVKPDS